MATELLSHQLEELERSQDMRQMRTLINQLENDSNQLDNLECIRLGGQIMRYRRMMAELMPGTGLRRES